MMKRNAGTKKMLNKIQSRFFKWQLKYQFTHVKIAGAIFKIVKNVAANYVKCTERIGISPVRNVVTGCSYCKAFKNIKLSPRPPPFKTAFC